MKKIHSLIIITIVTFFLIFGCTQTEVLESTNNNQNDTNLNSQNGGGFSNLDQFVKVKAGDNISVHYKGTLENGEQFDSSYDRGVTLDFTAGAGQMIKGFDAAVIGMKVGEKKTVTILAKDAYGDIEFVSIDLFDVNEDLEVGMIFNNGFSEIVIASIDGNIIGILNNHPLAGQNLIFEIEIVKIN